MWFGYRSCAPQSASLGAPWWRPSSTPWVGLVARTRVRSALVAPPPLGPKSYLLSLPGNLPPGGWLPTALSRPALGWGRGTGASPGPWSRPRQVQEGGLGTILNCVLGRRPGGFGSPWGGLSGHRPLYHPRFHLGASRLASGTMPTTFVLSPLRPFMSLSESVMPKPKLPYIAQASKNRATSVGRNMQWGPKRYKIAGTVSCFQNVRHPTYHEHSPETVSVAILARASASVAITRFVVSAICRLASLRSTPTVWAMEAPIDPVSLSSPASRPKEGVEPKPPPPPTLSLHF